MTDSTNDTNNEEMYDVEVKTSEEDDTAEVVITGSIPWAILEGHRSDALSAVSQSVDIDGFRKGNVPEEVLLQHVDEMRITQEMANRALSQAYPHILVEHEIDAIGRPEVRITKLTKGQPLEFSATTAVMPEVELPDYKEIAQEVNSKYDDAPEEPSDEEVQEAVKEIRSQWAKAEKLKKMQSDKSDESDPVDPREIEISDEELPELTDEFVSQLGDYKNVDEFENKLKENLAEQKKQEQEQKQRGEIMEQVIANTKTTIPRSIVDSELESMLAQFEADVTRSGMTLEDYFEQTEQTRDTLEERWRPDAKKRAKTQLVLAKIAGTEEITPDKEWVEKEVNNLLEHYEDADEERARMYVESQLTNEAVMKFLTEQKA